MFKFYSLATIGLITCTTIMVMAAPGMNLNCQKLSNGKSYCDEEFVVYDGSEVAFFGEGNADLILQEVQKFGLKPILLDNGNALVSIAFVNYKSTSIGSYREFILMYLVQNKNFYYHFSDVSEFLKASPNLNANLSAPNFGYYMKKLILDGEDQFAVNSAITIGKEAFGFPKEKGSVKIDIDNFSFGKKLSVQSADQTFALDIEAETYIGNFANVTLQDKIYQFSTGLNKLVTSEAEKTFRITRVMGFDSISNRIASQGTLAGVNLDSFYFTRWVFVPQFSFVFKKTITAPKPTYSPPDWSGPMLD